MLLGALAIFYVVVLMINWQRNRIFLCSTEWARKQGITPDNVRLFPFSARPVETIATEMGRPGGSPAPTRGRDYRTRQTLFGLPLAHTAWGIDPATGRPRVAKGIVAVGPVAYGVIAVGFSA